MNENKKNKTKFTAIEITPANFGCAACACPSVFETDRGTFILVGTKLDHKDMTEKMKKKIGNGETAIEIPQKLITGLFSKE